MPRGQAMNDQSIFFSGVQKMTNILWVRYDSIFNETAGGCKTCKMILKIIASCGNELKFDSASSFGVFFVVVLVL